MAKFQVNVSEARKKIESEREHSRVLYSYWEEIASVKSSLGFEVKQKQNIDKKLQTVLEHTYTMKGAMDNLSSVLIDVLNKYEQTETMIVNQETKVTWGDILQGMGKSALSTITGGVSDAVIDLVSSIQDNAFFSLTTVCKVAKDVKPIWKSLIKDTSIGDAFYFKDVKKLFGNIKLSTSNTSVKWYTGLKEAKGLANTVAMEGFSNFSTSEKFWNGLKTGAKSTINAATVWVTAILDGLSNYMDYRDGKMTGARAVAETITETAIDVGKNALITGAVTAGLAVLGVTSAPAVLVGVGVVAVSAVADVVCKWATKKYLGEEKGVTEAFSDLILDTVSAKWSQITSWFSRSSFSAQYA